jgi:hypothetical protein
MPDLRPLLAAGYEARVLRRGNLAEAQAKLRAALADPATRVWALARLSQIDLQTGGRLAERDFVASVHAGLLRDALRPE